MWQSGSQKQNCLPVSNVRSSRCCLKASNGDMVFQDVTVDRIPIREGQTAQAAPIEKNEAKAKGRKLVEQRMMCIVENMWRDLLSVICLLEISYHSMLLTL